MNLEILNSHKSPRKSVLERPGVSMVATCKCCADSVAIAKGMESLTVLHKEHIEGGVLIIVHAIDI